MSRKKMKRESGYSWEQPLLTHEWTGASSLPSKTWWEHVASKLHRFSGLQSSFLLRLHLFIFTNSQSSVLPGFRIQEEPWKEDLRVQAKGEIPGKRLLCPAP